jgi:hypothetical protein
MLIQFQLEPRKEHWIDAKHILRYLRGMITYGLRYASNNGVQLHGFIDSDFVGSENDINSTFSMCFSLGYTMISWTSRKQKSVALKTAEEKYIVACDACTKAM